MIIRVANTWFDKSIKLVLDKGFLNHKLPRTYLITGSSWLVCDLKYTELKFMKLSSEQTTSLQNVIE